jgi:hypothetical protein
VNSGGELKTQIAQLVLFFGEVVVGSDLPLQDFNIFLGLFVLCPYSLGAIPQIADLLALHFQLVLALF